MTITHWELHQLMRSMQATPFPNKRIQPLRSEKILKTYTGQPRPFTDCTPTDVTKDVTGAATLHLQDIVQNF